MPLAAAIETSGRIGSVAVALDGRVLAEEQFPHGLQHAARILPVLDSLLRGQGWRPADLDELYVATGPGSFTGLRIGVTLAKTLAMATGVKLVAVPSLRVLAENAPPAARHLILVLDAKRDQIFTARFERSATQGTLDDWIEKEPPHLDRLTDMLRRSPRPVHLLGEGLPYHEKFLDPTDGGVLLSPPGTSRARAGAVAILGHQLARAGHFTDPLHLSPLYIRLPEAEEKYQAEQGKLGNTANASNATDFR